MDNLLRLLAVTFRPMFKKNMQKSIVNRNDLYHLIKRDNLFKRVEEMFGMPPNWSRPPGFISLVKIILEQQVSLASAKANFLKLDTYLKGITPTAILKLSDLEMRSCQGSRQKAVYLRALSEAIVTEKISLERLAFLPVKKIRNELTSIKGIGQWNADIYLMFCLQEKDIFPIGDIALVTTVREITGMQSKEEMLLFTEHWSPYRSLAAYFLWHYYLSSRNKSPCIE